MKIKQFILILLILSIAIPAPVFARKTITLVPPKRKGGMPLMEALVARQSSREFDTKMLDRKTLSNLLWAAWGINRVDSLKRTAPSSRNCQDIDVYVVMKNGIYLYHEKMHNLKQIEKGDHRALTGKQDFVADAPVNLVYVSNLDRIKDKEKEAKLMTAASDAAFISQNVYLFCASEKLATVVRAWVDFEALGKKLKLNKNQRVILCQTVGYPSSKKDKKKSK